MTAEGLALNADQTGAEPRPPADVSSSREAAVVAALYVGSIAVALVASAVLVASTGGSWRAVFSALLDGSLRAPGRWGQTLGVAVPLMLVALGTVINGRAGLINIGQEGQLTVGAATAAYAGTHLAGPGVFVLAGLILSGIAAGAVWAGIAGVLLYWRRVPEVLTTLLLVTVGAQAVGYGLQRQWLLLAPIEGRSSRNIVSEKLAPDSRIPRVSMFGNEFPTSILLALALAVVVTWLLARSVWGFRLRMLGRNARTAHRAGVSEWRFGMGALLLSGGFAGLAGAAMLAGGDFGNYRLTPFFAVGLGFDGLLVALVARQRPLLVVPLALVFASLRTGSGFLAATGVEREITQIVQSMLVLALLVPPAILFIRERRRALAATTART
jgi:simple sugar transport system permease protein